jgi:hypothetical protein
MEDCKMDVAGAPGDNEPYKFDIHHCDAWRCEALRSLGEGTSSLYTSFPLHTDERTLHCRRWSERGPNKINLEIHIYVLRSLHLLTRAVESYGAPTDPAHPRRTHTKGLLVSQGGYQKCF